MPRLTGVNAQNFETGTYAADVVGIPLGVPVLTLDGVLPVEHLTAGDQIITRDRGAVPLVFLESFTLPCESVRFCANTLGRNRPERDMVLPAAQPVLVRDWRAQILYDRQAVLVEAARLVDGEFVQAEAESEMTLFRLVFDAPHVVYAGGLELGIAPF